MAYSGKFRTVDIFSQFHVHYSGIAHKQIMHNLNLTWADAGIFRTLACLGTYCFMHI